MANACLHSKLTVAGDAIRCARCGARLDRNREVVEVVARIQRGAKKPRR